jgi:hypothetical protein
LKTDKSILKKRRKHETTEGTEENSVFSKKRYPPSPYPSPLRERIEVRGSE